MDTDRQRHVALPRSDADIANDVANALMRDADVPDETIVVHVHDRWVWLTGEAKLDRQRLAAGRAAESISGIKGVANLVRLTR